MPVDTSPSNAIIQAFLAGRDLARQKEQDKQAKEDRELAKKELERQRKLEEQKADQDAQIQEARFNFEKVIHDINKLKTTQEIGEKYSESGIEPSGVKVTKPAFHTPEGIGNQPIASDLSGIPQGQVELESPILGKIRTYAPEEYQRRKVAQAEAAQAPIRETARQKEEFETKRQVELKKVELEQKQKEWDEQYRRAIDVAKIRAAAQRNPVDSFLDRPIPPDIQRDTFGKTSFDPNFTYRSAGNADLTAKLTPVEKAEIKNLDSIEDAAYELKKYLDEDPARYNYFEGGTGLIADIGASLRGGETDPTASQIRTKLGKLQQIIALADFGKVIPSGEKEILKGYAPSTEHRQTGQSVKDKLTNLIKYNSDLKARTLTLASGATVKTQNQVKEGNIVELNGKRIKITKVYSDGSFDGDEVK